MPLLSAVPQNTGHMSAVLQNIAQNSLYVLMKALVTVELHPVDMHGSFEAKKRYAKPALFGESGTIVIIKI